MRDDNRGLMTFIAHKKLDYNQVVSLFMSEQTNTNGMRAHRYIQANWDKFATFVDKGLKSGRLKGKDIKLNTYYSEQKEYHNKIKAEFESVNLTEKEQELLNYIQENGPGKLQNKLIALGIKGLGKDLSYTSKKLQWLQLVRLFISNNLQLS